MSTIYGRYRWQLRAQANYDWNDLVDLFFDSGAQRKSAPVELV